MWLDAACAPASLAPPFSATTAPVIPKAAIQNVIGPVILAATYLERRFVKQLIPGTIAIRTRLRSISILAGTERLPLPQESKRARRARALA